MVGLDTFNCHYCQLLGCVRSEDMLNPNHLFCACDLIWKVLWRYNQVKMKSYLLSMGRKSKDWCSTENRLGDTQICWQPWENRGRNWSDASITWGLSKIASNYQNVEKVKDRFFSRAIQGSMALLTTWFWTSCLQNYKRIHLFNFKLCSLWCFFMAAKWN